MGPMNTFLQTKVFVVDDDADMCQLLESVLGNAGYTCTSFSSPKEFLNSLEMNVRGCLLLDICMPEMSGLDLQSALIERGWPLPIIFLSAAADVPTAVHVLQQGAANIIEKPWKNAVLIQAVQDAIERDASASGIGILHGASLKAGLQFLIKLGTEERANDELVLSCVVKNCHRITSELYGIGATFKKHVCAEPPISNQAQTSNNNQAVWPCNPESPTEAERLKIQRAILD